MLKKSFVARLIMNYFLSLGGERIKVRVISAFKGKGLRYFIGAANEATPTPA
jgi:hypothetical protein